MARTEEGQLGVDQKGMAPADVFGKKWLTKQGESVVFQNGHLVAVRW